MKEPELKEKVENYLMKSNSVYVENSVEYIGIRENYIIANKEPKDYYLLGFDAVADKSNIYSTQSYFVFIEKASEKISYILGPQHSEIIE
ncbi:hypothetical protein EZY14_013420 [Kordia sp. TARA_039_SRF]|nr:hypothetical protein EZY14_013420 [Kordia sp. TARA_039_SRF]